MKFDEFLPVFAALTMQLRWTDADEVTARAYFDPLQDLEIEFVADAARKFALSRCEFHPKTSEWRVEALKVEADRVEELRARLRKRTEPLCLACDDTQWERIPDTNQVKKCSCASLRRLEVLGRRPMPALTEGSGRTVPVDVERVAKALADPAQMR